MIENKSLTSVAKEAKVVFERIKDTLEKSSPNQFVAIEPVSGDYFLGATLSDAIGASRLKYPDRLAHAFRVGHPAAIHFGMQIR